MRALLFAYHDIGVRAIETLQAMGVEICAVFTHQDDPGENVWFGSARKAAERFGLPVFTPENVNVPEWIEKIRALSPEIIFSFYYRNLICEEILRVPRLGAFNLHGSLLPKFRGRAPVNWAILAGEKETGLTLHYMVRQADAGDIVAQKKVSIGEEDTALDVFCKLTPLVEELLRETVPLLKSGKAPKIAQDPARATTFKGRKPEDGKIDWGKSAREIHNLVRAVTHPYPGAFCFLDGKKIFIWSSKAREGSGARPGEVTSLEPLLVQAGSGGLELVRVQADGGEEQPGSVFASRNGLKIGKILG